MSEMIKIEGSPTLLRDPHSKAVLNTNIGEREARKQQRDFFLSMQAQKNEVEKLKEEFGEMKDALFQILNLLKDKK
jgi:HAMP domain-containing protein